MAEKVTCTVKGDTKYSDCRCITQIRTNVRTYTRLEAHRRVTNEPGSIYVEGGGARADVVPAEREGMKYVRTRSDDTTADNLLKAPVC